MNCWAQPSQETLNQAINQLLKILKMVIKATGAHTEFQLDSLCVLITIVVIFAV